MPDYKVYGKFIKGYLTELTKPLNDKHSSEGSLIGVTLVSEIGLVRQNGFDQNYKLYEFNSCGHRQYLQPTHVRRNNVKCSVCFEQSISSSLTALGYTLIGKGSSAAFRLVKRNICGHVTEMRHTNTSKKEFAAEELNYTCSECYESRLHREAKEKNLTYLGQALSKKGVFRHYKFNSCGHTKDINSGCVARGNFECKQCKEVAYSESASSVGLEYVGYCDNKSDYKRKYKLPCGHIKELRMDHAKDGSYLCDYCGDSHYTKPSSVYLLKIKNKDGFTWLKLGYAFNVNLRLSNYGLDINDCEVEILKILNTPTGAMAASLERAWHKEFKSFKVDSKFMKNYHKGNGHTECYYLTAEQSLILAMANAEDKLNE